MTIVVESPGDKISDRGSIPLISIQKRGSNTSFLLRRLHPIVLYNIHEIYRSVLLTFGY